MTDNDVGDLWRSLRSKYCDCESGAGDGWKVFRCQAHNSGIKLIRKLVEERKELYAELWGYKEPLRTNQALASFGIDPKDWR
jgi:hypothetical protein